MFNNSLTIKMNYLKLFCLMNTTIKIYLRLDNKNVDGTNSVCLRFTLKRKIKVFTLNVRVLSKDWNKTKTF